MNRLVDRSETEYASTTFIPHFDVAVTHRDDMAMAHSLLARVWTLRVRTAALVLCLVMLIGAFCPTTQAQQQAGEWDWVNGTAVTASYRFGMGGSYGTQGVAAASNIPPPRDGMATWIDHNGNLWMFGGWSGSLPPEYNDLWEYQPSTGYWTWISGGWNGPPASGTYPLPSSFGTLGVPAASNLPSPRYGATSWVDSSGKLWMFGGWGFDSSNAYTSVAIGLNDLWTFDPSTGYWTWMGGSSIGKQIGNYGILDVASATNSPGGRTRAASWVDKSGNLWIFGGTGYGTTTSSGALSDLWELNTQTLQWTWMGGNTAVNKIGVYGTKGTAAATNNPGGMALAQAWVDPSGNLWLFGGQGYPKVAASGYLDDLWEYSPSTGEWTWISGDAATNEPSVYGTLGVEAATTHPGGRYEGGALSDGAGGFWLLDGQGITASSSSSGHIDDVWKFDTDTGYWAWMGGSTTPSPAAVYNAQGVANSTNDPGGRNLVVISRGNDDNFWLFGGDTTVDQNDLWEYKFPAAATPVFSPPGGTYSLDQTVSLPDSASGSVIYYTTDGTTPTILSTQYTVPITVNTQKTLQAIAIVSGYSASPVATGAYTFDRPPAATPVFNPASGTYPGTQVSVTISDATSSPTIYYTTDGSTPTSSSLVYSGSLTVTMPATIKAVATAFEYTTSAVASASYSQAIVATPVFSVASGAYTGPQTISITDATPSSIIYYTTDGSTPTTGSDVYTSSIELSLSSAVKAIAVASGYLNSTVSVTSYTINYPSAVISSISPVLFTSATTTTLTITGSGFYPVTNLYIGLGTSSGTSGTAVPTQYVSPTELTAQFPASYLSTLQFGAYFFVSVGVPGTNTVSNEYFMGYGSPSSNMPITITPSTQTVAAGGTTTYFVTVPSVTLGTLNIGGYDLPSGATFQWTPTSNVPNAGTITIATSSSTPPGTYTILVLGGGQIPVSSQAGLLLPILLLPLLFLRKRLAAKGVWLTLSMGLILLASAPSFTGCAATGPKYTFGATNATVTGSNATTITLTVQ